MQIFKQKKIRRVLRNDFSFQTKSNGLSFSKVPFKNKLFGFLSGSALIIIFGLLIWHPAFQIRVIIIHGLERSDYAEVHRTVENILNSKRFGLLPRNNYFLVNHSELKEIIGNRFFFEEVSISKKFPNSLLINVRERQPAVIILRENVLTLVDSNALIVEKRGRFDSSITETTTTENINIDSSSQNNFPLLIFSVGLQSQPEKDKQLIGGVLAWNNFITKSFNASVINYLIETETSGSIITKDGWRILVNFTENREAQFTALNAAFKQKNFNTKDLHYIDVRYPGRVYWQ